MQRTGSFKERGARNALLLLSDDVKRRGVITASAGNHALGLSYHGGLLNIPVTVVMPKIAPLTKITNCRHLGANVILEGANIEEARQAALKLVEQKGLRYINGYDDPPIIAGQGTIGLEILEQVPDVDAIIVPVGGRDCLPAWRSRSKPSGHLFKFSESSRNARPVIARRWKQASRY